MTSGFATFSTVFPRHILEPYLELDLSVFVADDAQRTETNIEGH